MAIYPYPPPHERLNVFFGEFFREMRKAEPSTYGAFLERAEEEFNRTGYREKISSGVENILIVRLDAIGDMILTSGFIREVRANFPKARITLIVSPIVYPIVELCPYVNEVLAFDLKSLNAKSFLEAFENIAVFCRDNLWRKNFSIAFSPRCYPDVLNTLIMLWLSGAKERVGYGTSPYRGWVDSPPPPPPIDNFLLTKNIITSRNVITDADRNFFLLTAAGLKINQTRMELFYSAEDFYRAKILLENIPSSSKKVLLGIGTRENNKKYPVEKYLVALKELAKKDLVFVVVGGKNEIDDANFLEKNLPNGKVLNLAGKTPLRVTEAIAAQTDFYLGNDTGVMHMAAAVQLPCLVLYREAWDRDNIFLSALSICAQRFPPLQTKSIILRPKHPLDECANLPLIGGICRRSEPHCITQITPQEIIDAFEVLETL